MEFVAVTLWLAIIAALQCSAANTVLSTLLTDAPSCIPEGVCSKCLDVESRLPPCHRTGYKAHLLCSTGVQLPLNGKHDQAHPRQRWPEEATIVGQQGRNTIVALSCQPGIPITSTTLPLEETHPAAAAAAAKDSRHGYLTTGASLQGGQPSHGAHDNSLQALHEDGRMQAQSQVAVAGVHHSRQPLRMLPEQEEKQQEKQPGGDTAGHSHPHRHRQPGHTAGQQQQQHLQTSGAETSTPRVAQEGEVMVEGGTSLTGEPRHLSLFQFELLMLAVLAAALPVVYWRKIRIRHL